MKNKNYKYDVAFAFLKKDENLANQINDLIHDNYSSYLYSKNLEDIHNTKPGKTFLEVFGKKSKIVVVLFRNKWGTTPWTEIEEKVIRDRASKEGEDFLIIIPLDNPPITPKYLPQAQIWADLLKSGIKGASNTIKEKLRSFRTGSEKVLQINLDIDSSAETEFEVERSKFLQSVNGLEIAKLELKKLFTELKKFKDKTEKVTKGLTLSYHQDEKSCTIYSEDYSIRFYMQPSKNNPVMDTYIYFELQKKGSSSNDSNILSVEQYVFDLKKVREYGWIKEADSNSFISSKKLAERSINQLLDHANI